MINELTQEMSFDWGIWVSNWFNAYNIAGNSALMGYVVGNNLGDVTITNANNYQVESAQNSNGNLNISSINSNYLNNGGNVLNTAYTNFGSNILTLESGIANQATSDDTTPIKQSANQINSGQTNQVQGVQIAEFLQKNFQEFQKGWQEILYKCFNQFLLPVNDLDTDVWGYNW